MQEFLLIWGTTLTPLIRILHMLYYRFKISVEFRAIQPDGILLYMESDRTEMPDSVQPRPEYFFCLYLYQGKLMVAMAMKKEDSPTATVEKMEIIRQKGGSSYSDLQWHSVRYTTKEIIVMM